MTMGNASATSSPKTTGPSACLDGHVSPVGFRVPTVRDRQSGPRWPVINWWIGFVAS